jgi:tripeptidyl-peptidase-1
VTLLSAAGDWGVTGPNNTVAGCGYNPLFPASNPYVVSVGGTQGTDEEVVCQGNMHGAITSGGGFSGYYPQPAYQRANVSAYFEQETPYSDPSKPFQSFNKSNRGYPDVSAQAAFYSFMYYSTIQIGFAGTSAATPVNAAMFSLINAARQIPQRTLLESWRSCLGS